MSNYSFMFKNLIISFLSTAPNPNPNPVNFSKSPFLVSGQF